MTGTILVAEDETLPRKNICQLLEEKRFSCSRSCRRKSGPGDVDNFDLDLILTDLKMPGADGVEVLKHAREVSPQTLVLMMTAYASVDTVVEALRLGAQDYILKPVVLEDKGAQVERLIEHRSLAWRSDLACDRATGHGAHRRSQGISKLSAWLKKSRLASTVRLPARAASAERVAGQFICAVRGRTRCFCRSIAVRSQITCWKANCSAIKRAPLQAR
jgi:DNA-binding NtrC family response regulator